MTADSGMPEHLVKHDARRMYLAGLIQKIRSHPDFMRQFLEGKNQNSTLGLAAETGIRDVLRAVLPSSFGVTSGFMCQADGSLIEPSAKEELSPQTDVILYNASYACPFYRMNDIEVLAARDALGFVEVKDWKDGEPALHGWTDKPGALSHIARLIAHAPDAFRAVVLLRSGEQTREDAVKAAHDQCKQQAQCKQQKLTSLNVPHLIYCVEGGYTAVFEYTSNKVHFFDYEDDDGTSALADFLRVLTSFFAARGFASSSLALGLSAGKRFKRKIIESLQLNDRAPLPSLRDMVSAHDVGIEHGIEPSFERRLAQFVEQHVQDLYCTATTGRDQDTNVCGGVVVIARLKDKPNSYAASFFVLKDQGFLTCVDSAPTADPAKEEDASPQVPWIIAHERPELYFQRVCRRLPASRDPFCATDEMGASVEREET